MLQQRIQVNGFERSKEEGEIITTLYLADGQVIKGSETGFGKYKKVTHQYVAVADKIPDSGFLETLRRLVSINYQLLDNTYVLIGGDELTIITYNQRDRDKFSM